MKTVRPLILALSISFFMGLSVAAVGAQPFQRFTPEVARAEAAGTILSVVADGAFESAALRVAGPGGYEASARSQGEPLVLDLVSDGRVFARERGMDVKIDHLPDGRYAWEARFLLHDGAERTAHGALFVEGGTLLEDRRLSEGRAAPASKPSASPLEAPGDTRIAAPLQVFEDAIAAHKTVQIYDIGSPLGQTWLALYSSTASAYFGDSWGIENHDGSINFFELDSPAVHRDRFTFTPEGYLGIGTTAPVAPLHLASGTVVFGDPALWTLFADSIGFDVRSESTGGYPFHISPSTPQGTLSLAAAGVGIGTESPLARLHVKGGAIVEGDVALGSSRSIKHEIAALDTAQVLAGIRELPLYSWKYLEDPVQATHLGPMAEDFHAAFRVGRDDKHISPTDSAGLALAGVQGVDRAVTDLRALVEALDLQNDRLAAENRELLKRLENIERRLAARD